MTTQTPAPKASGVSSLLASLSSISPLPEPTVKEDFLAMMLQALTSRPAGADKGGADDSPTAQPPKEKPASSTPAAVPDPTAASLLLAWLTPPLFELLKSPSHQVSAPSIPLAPASAPTAATPAQSLSESKPQRRDAAATLTAQAPPPKEPDSKSPPASGTPVANAMTRMNLSMERNEIAGRTEQKLPPAAISAVTSADTGGSSPDGGAKTPLPFFWHESPSEPLAIIDLSANAASAAAPVAAATVDAPVRVADPAPIDRLEQMISREAMTVRQTGAETLGVALKLDANTQLFLQLTTHNGLVQASVRCDRGQFAPEDAQWAELQQSLARQNVELLPMTGGSNLNFQQPSGQHPRPQAAREDWPAAGAAAQSGQPRKQKEQKRSRKNWESWA